MASGSAVRRLTGYYERAKFSAHEIDAAMKDEAIRALETIRDELLASEADRLGRGGAMNAVSSPSAPPGWPRSSSLVIVLTAVPDQRALALQVYAFGCAAIVLLWLLGRTGAARDESPRSTSARRVEPPEHEALVDLARVEREVTLGVANAYDLHYRLRPRDPGDRDQPAGRPPGDRSRAPAGGRPRGARRAGGLGARPPRPAAAAQPPRTWARAAAACGR